MRVSQRRQALEQMVFRADHPPVEFALAEQGIEVVELLNLCCQFRSDGAGLIKAHDHRAGSADMLLDLPAGRGGDEPVPEFEIDESLSNVVGA